MGRSSLRENKNIYQVCREECGLTRARASEELEWISDSRIEKIESERTVPTPDEVVAMEKAYKKPGLSSYYCANECAIGKSANKKPTEEKTISEIVLEVLATLNNLDKQKERLIEITQDGMIDDDNELRDFIEIQKKLEKIASTVDSLRLWVSRTINEGGIDENTMKKFLEE